MQTSYKSMNLSDRSHGSCFEPHPSDTTAIKTPSICSRLKWNSVGVKRNPTWCLEWTQLLFSRKQCCSASKNLIKSVSIPSPSPLSASLCYFIYLAQAISLKARLWLGKSSWSLSKMRCVVVICRSQRLFACQLDNISVKWENNSEVNAMISLCELILLHTALNVCEEQTVIHSLLWRLCKIISFLSWSHSDWCLPSCLNICLLSSIFPSLQV